MTHLTITDSSTCTVNGAGGSLSVTGPAELDCYSVTIGGNTYAGTLLLSGGVPFQLLEHSPRQMDMHAPLLAFAFLLGLIASRFRL